ncbi:MAG: HPr family phosphocarrier protein [Pseudomonadota bacterium]
MTATVSATLDIVNEKGLHARASARFVETVEAHVAKAEVSRDGQTVNGDSIMGLLMLGASMGTTIDVVCTGADADLLLAALSDLVADCFGEGK